jgi:RimJ/RimL family protein N-acetyltransferase
MKPIETKRLILREWTLEDLPFFAAINQDPIIPLENWGRYSCVAYLNLQP